MKTKIFSILFCVILGVTNTAYSQKTKTNTSQTAVSYDALWKDVKRQEDSSLPESAGQTVEKIYQKALQEKNSSQLLKSLIHQLKYQQVKDGDLLPDKLKEIENYTAQATDIAEQSMLYSMLSQLYLQYYQSNYSINRRTAITGYIPEDIREWTGNIFVQKIKEYVFLSAKNETVLQQTNVLKYKEILNEGSTSRTLRPTLYDFLLAEGISTLANLRYQAESFFTQSQFQDNRYFADAGQFVQLSLQAKDDDLPMQTLLLYQRLLAFRQKGNNPQALLMTDLDRLQFIYDNAAYDQRNDDYLQALSGLEKNYEKDPFCAEILYRKASFLSYNYGYQPFTESNEDAEKFLGYKKQAYEICQKGIEKYPSYERIDLLKNLLKEMTRPWANVSSGATVYPGKDLEMKIQYQNTPQLTIEIYRISSSATAFKDIRTPEGMYKTKGKIVEKRTIRLDIPAPYIQRDTIIRIPMQSLGYYEYVVSQDNQTDIANQAFSVSRLATLTRTYDGKKEVLVTDGISGKPVQNAEVRFHSMSGGKLKYLFSGQTDKDGLCSSTKEIENGYYQAILGSDSALLVSNIMQYYDYTPRQTAEKLSIFTDRSIYRPGQTVYFKGIATQADKDKQEVISNKKYTLSLKDTNGKEISTKAFSSNDLGSFSGEFILPQGVLGGYFSITSDNAYCSFRVEEYKRPTFDIQFDTIAGTSNFGDQIQVKGNAKTFSGVNLQYSEVKYRITQAPLWILYRYASYGKPPRQIAEGTVKTDDDGNFELSFPAEKQFSDKDRKNIYYTYMVEVSITDSNGETQESTTQVSIGDKSMYLTIGNLDLVDKDKPSPVSIKASNLNGKSVQKEGTYQIFRLQAEESLEKELKTSDWKPGKQITSGNFSTEKDLDLSALLLQATSGKYRIMAQSKDDKGREISTEQDFTLYSAKDKQPPVMTYQWFIPVKTDCNPGENAEILYGSSAGEVYVLYEIFKDKKLLERSRFLLNNETKKISIPFKESYGEGVVVQYAFIKNGKPFFSSTEIKRTEPDKKLNLKMEVFRNRLLPGQKEEWKLSVRDAAQQPVSAEVLTEMYDASLDKLYTSDWVFSPENIIMYPRINFIAGRSMDNTYSSIQPDIKIKDVPDFSFDSFNWFGLNFYGRSLRAYSFSEGAMLDGRKNKSPAAPLAQAAAGVKSESIRFSEPMVVEMADSAVPASEGQVAPQVRSNFNETAFFYPHLLTNKEGETLISFTVPESNTTWKFRSLAHTRDLKYGQLTEQIISQKQLMVTPNMPRFMREGDETTISTNISNLSGRAQSGKASIILFDPETEKPITEILNNTQNFQLEAGETTTLSWTFDVPAGIDLAACKIVAQSENFSDGEQHLLPVLPNRMLVTESLPLDISGKENKEFTFGKLTENKSETAENYRLTLEFASNPVWYAVQALPSMTTPSSDNAVSWFASYYANSLAASIANSTPRVKQVIDIWTQQGGTKESLVSNLEKNQELKTVLLEETPWVMEARNETEQKQRLGLLFDLNRNNNLSLSAINKLQELQTEDGGWTWFKGMYSSPSITQWILYGFGQLEQMKALSNKDDIANMLQQGIAFMDRKFKENFEARKKYDKDWKKSQSISSYELEYLYVRSFYKDIPLNGTEEAVKFHTDILARYWTKNTNLYQRALAAMIMQRNGQKIIAQQMTESLKQHAVQKSGMGMYWANNNAHAFFFQSATSIHTFIMQAFQETGATQETMDLMKLWLLKQKQTQEWESTPATANAVYVLLKTGSNWLESSGTADIKLGKKPVSTTEGEAGTGYIKQIYPASEITPDMGHVSISKQDQGPAWGALYWQYFEDLDKITQAKTGLNVEKKLFVERVSETGKILDPLDSYNIVNVGDKVIVRLTVRNDRDMEYVMLKDMHAACFEPAEQISGSRWKESVVYYQTNKDVSTSFYFQNLPKGTYVFEYPLFVTRTGEYSNGISTIQCLYAPEFTSHTQGGRIIAIGKGVNVVE